MSKRVAVRFAGLSSQIPVARLPRVFTPTALQQVMRYVLVTIALVATVAGAIVTLRTLVMPDVTAQVGDTIAIDHVRLNIAAASWIAEHKHTDDTNEITLVPAEPDGSAVDQAGGFAMPAAMMPGMPEEGLRRLRMVVSLANTGDQTQTVSAADFTIVADDGQSWLPLANSSFRGQHLTPGQAVEGVLFADIPADTPGLTVVWKRSAGTVRFPLGTAPAHEAAHS